MKIISIIFVLLLVTACGTESTPPPPEENPVVANVNGLEFTLAQLEREDAFDRATHKLLTGETLLQDRADTLEGVIPTLMLDQKALEAGFSATDAEIATGFEQFVVQQNIEPAALDAELSRYGYGLSDFEAYIARSVRIEKYLDSVFSDPAMQNMDISDWLVDIRQQAEIEIFYKVPDELPLVNSTAPKFTLTNLRGEAVNLEMYRGRPVVLNFWATWCVPCKTEMPVLENAWQTHQDAGLVILAVNFEEDAELVEPFVSELGLTFEVLYDPDAAVSKDYQVTGLPATFFIDRQGVIQHIQIGQLREEMLEEILGTIL